MKRIKVGINGFGRMGRLGFRAALAELESPGFEVVHINEPNGDAACAAHLLEYDTVHGRWDAGIEAGESSFSVGGRSIGYSSKYTVEEVDWAGLGCDIVVESSGKFKSPEKLQPYFDNGVKKVVVAAPVKEGALNVVVGCNDHIYDPAVHKVVTAASCTTNCIAPAIKVVHEKIGIKRGTITTLHDVTNTQVIVDAPHKDLRRARSALNSLIPTSTGSATAITMIYPELTGKLDGVAVRVPLLNASLTDCVFHLNKSVTVDEVNALLKEASETYLSGILGFETKPLVSSDYTNDKRSGIVDAPSTMMVDGELLKLLVWYDNEWGYANRLMELTDKVAKSIA